MDLAARQLRNLANQDRRSLRPRSPAPLPFDLVFQTSDPSRSWVRYCLDTAATAGQPSSASRGMLWESEHATATAPNSSMMGELPRHGLGLAADRVGPCDQPHERGGPQRVHLQLRGRRARGLPGQRRRPHAYHQHQRPAVGRPEPGQGAGGAAGGLEHLPRNQNEAPVAEFNTAAAGSRTVILNGSASTDPEGRMLAYDWFLGNGAITLTPEEACAQEIKQKANGTTLIYLGQGTTTAIRCRRAWPRR